MCSKVSLYALLQWLKVSWHSWMSLKASLFSLLKVSLHLVEHLKTVWAKLLNPVAVFKCFLIKLVTIISYYLTSTTLLLNWTFTVCLTSLVNLTVTVHNNSLLNWLSLIKIKPFSSPLCTWKLFFVLFIWSLNKSVCSIYIFKAKYLHILNITTFF